MTAFINFTRRNLRIFFRNKGSVFASLLTMIIIIVLMLVFLGDTYGGELADAVSACNPLLDAEKVAESCSCFMLLWTLGGVLIVNTVTITTTAMGAMVNDEAEKRLQSFYAAPVKRWLLTVSYIFSAWLIAIIMSMGTLVAAEIILAATGNALLTALQLIKLIGLIAVGALTFSCIAYLIASCVHSIGAWTAIQTIVGTLVGFAAGCYVPVSMLSETVCTVLKLQPYLNGSAMLRTVCLEGIHSDFFAELPSVVTETIYKEFGITLELGGHTLTLAEHLLIFLAYTIICLGIAILITRKRRLKTA